MSRRRGVARLLLALVVLVTASGCASIQDQSQPVAVPNPPNSDAGQTISGPAPGIDRWKLVRQFVQANAQPEHDYRVARAFLSAGRARDWNPGTRVTVVGDDVATVPSPDDDSADANQQRVLLRAPEVGTLNPDGSFSPPQSGQKTYEQTLTVHRNRDGQWRITNVDNGLVVRLSDFQRAYQQVTLYFVEPRLQAPIPDVRYLPRGPAHSVATRIVNGLIHGPSKQLRSAVSNNFSGLDPRQHATVSAGGDESVRVDLPPVGNASDDQRDGMIEQIVRSLRGVIGSEIEVRSQGEPLLRGKSSVKYSDLPQYTLFTPAQEADPLYVAGGTLHALPLTGDPNNVTEINKQLSSTSGLPHCQAGSAARSLDGKQLAVTCAGRDQLQHLWIGQYGKGGDEIPNLAAQTFTRPTWTVGSPQNQVGYTVWTVANGHTVEQLHRSDDQWQASTVDTTALHRLFGADASISTLRLSRDGVRAALVVDGKLVVCTVLRDDDGTARLTAPTIIATHGLGSTVSQIDWTSETQLLVVSGEDHDHLSTVSADGLYATPVSTTNMSAPIEHIASAPGQPYLAVANGTTFSSDPSGGDSWIPVASMPKGSWPFYAG